MRAPWSAELTDEQTFSLMVSSRLAPDPYSIYMLSVTLAQATRALDRYERETRRARRAMVVALGVLIFVILADIGVAVARFIH